MMAISAIKKLARSSFPGFLIVGLAGTCTNLLVFYVLVDHLKWGATRTAILAFAICVTQNYLLNHRFNFRDKVNDAISLDAYVRYVAVNLAGLVANLVVMNVLLFVFASHQPKVFSQFFGIGAGTILNYFGAKRIVFKAKPRAEGR